jgi:DNA-binding transcriptional MerR regulator/methylmalonyl-CoA mutase cobalamin-binding subunit
MSTAAGYRIKTVASLTGVPRNTLLAWERRYRFVSPDRSGNRYRVYSEADVTLIREVKALVDSGHAVSEAVAMIQGRVGRAAAPATTPVAMSDTLDQTADQILAALLSFDRARADEAFGALVHASYEDLLDRVFFPILTRVGDGWASGDVTVLQEHLVSAFCRDHLVAMLIRLGSGPAAGPRAVCACTPDEAHELGLLGVSIRLALQGWRVTHLGARVPEAELRDFVAEHTPDLVCVSCLVPVRKRELLGYARRLRKALPARGRLAIGGAGVPDDVETQAVPGVQFCRDFANLSLR